MLGDVNFMRSLEDFDKDNIPDAVIKKLRRYIDDPNYQPDVVAKQSKAAMSLCMWTRAMDVYNRCALVHARLACRCLGAGSTAFNVHQQAVTHMRAAMNIVPLADCAKLALCFWPYVLTPLTAGSFPPRVAKVVEPKRQKLREAEAQLEQANAQLQEKQDALAAVVSRVNSLKKQLADAQSEQCKLNDQVRRRLGAVVIDMFYFCGCRQQGCVACARQPCGICIGCVAAS